MLHQLHISNFTIIESLHIDFSKNYNIFTGETGAGKSIILTALNLLCGKKFEASLARVKKDKVVVEGIFSLNNLKNEWLLELLEGEDLSEVLIRREILPSGRNKCSINQHIVRVSDLKSIYSSLVNIHSQHETYALLDSQNHFKFFSMFGGQSFSSELEKYHKIYDQYFLLRKKKEKQSQRMQELKREMDRLQFELEEISAASFYDGEEKELSELHLSLVNQSTIEEKLVNVRDLIDSSLENSLGAKVYEVNDILSSLNDIDIKSKGLYDSSQLLIDSLESLSFHLADYESISSSQENNSLEEIEERISLLEQLKKKYGSSIQDILHYEKKSSDQLFNLMKEESSFESIDNEINALEIDLIKLSQSLTQMKKKIGLKLQEHINSILSLLNMLHASFKVEFLPIKNFLSLSFDKREINLSRDGAEEVEFYLSSNKGQEFQPLVRVASGGEISRVMLALKHCFASIHPASTFIFDEIDSGVGGDTAHKIAKVLREIAQNKQVIVITHLAQVALKADKHFVVEKIDSSEKTISNIRELKTKEVEKELARMMGLENSLSTKKVIQELYQSS
ncbi:MAG: DNA repair protein RecN [Candidatus Cloacimonadota bacterium]|nr:MAG: DNA repair protein RecN [Candidatus Cloacimonadota bacterium]